MTAARSRRRNSRDRRSRTPPLEQGPWQAIQNTFVPVELLSADQIESIHEASLSILETLGIEVMNERACDLFAAAGAHTSPPTHW